MSGRRALVGGIFFLIFYFFIYDSHTEREAETQAEGKAGSMHWEPNVGFDPGSPGSHPGRPISLLTSWLHFKTP